METTWREDIIWLAGLVEGEGCFLSVSGAPQRPRFELTSTDEDVIRRAQSIVNVGGVYGPYIRKGEFNYKPKWRWMIHNSKDTMGLMYMLYPFMGERRKSKIEIQNRRIGSSIFGCSRL